MNLLDIHSVSQNPFVVLDEIVVKWIGVTGIVITERIDFLWDHADALLVSPLLLTEES
jgi:hypothetical protein